MVVASRCYTRVLPPSTMRVHRSCALQIVDRSKDVIKSGGEWISSVAIGALCTSPGWRGGGARASSRQATVVLPGLGQALPSPSTRLALCVLCFPLTHPTRTHATVENLAVGHPKVAEAAVIAIPDPKWSERPLLIVVPKEGQVRWGAVRLWWRRC